MASEGPLPPTSHFAAAALPQGTPYPSVADLEVAGERQAACALDTEHASAVGLQDYRHDSARYLSWNAQHGMLSSVVQFWHVYVGRDGAGAGSRGLRTPERAAHLSLCNGSRSTGGRHQQTADRVQGEDTWVSLY